MGKHALFVSSMKTGTRRVIILDELSSVVRLERRTTENSSSRRITRLLPVFILETNNVCLPNFAQPNNASSTIKTDNRNNRFKWQREIIISQLRLKAEKLLKCDWLRAVVF